MHFNEWLNLRESDSGKLHGGLQTIREMMKNRTAHCHSEAQDWSGPMKVAQQLAQEFPEYKQQFSNIWHAIENIANRFRDYAQKINILHRQDPSFIPLKDPKIRQEYEDIIANTEGYRNSIATTIEGIYKRMGWR